MSNILEKKIIYLILINELLSRKVSFGKFVLMKEPETTPPPKTSHAFARDMSSGEMSLRSSSTSINSIELIILHANTIN